MQVPKYTHTHHGFLTFEMEEIVPQVNNLKFHTKLMNHGHASR